MEAMDATGPVQDGIALPARARRLVQLSPTVGWQVGRGRPEVGSRIPVASRNLPTGTGRRLRPLSEPYVAFWRAWAAFHPDTKIARGG